MILVVNKRNIKMGVRGDCENCPIALALKRTFKTKDVLVGLNEPYYVTQDNEMVNFKITKSMERFIERFDEEKPVKPSRFRLITVSRSRV